jgi:transposase-like protein
MALTTTRERNVQPRPHESANSVSGFWLWIARRFTLTCHSCKIEAVKAGKGRNAVQRFKCQQCGKRFSESQQKPFGADVRLPKETVCRILHCLVEGNSVRGTARLCDVEPRTVLNMLTRLRKKSLSIPNAKSSTRLDAL